MLTDNDLESSTGAQCAQMAILWKKIFLNTSKINIAIKMVLYMQNSARNHLE